MLPTVMMGRCVILLLLVVMSLLISFSQNVCRVKHMLWGQGKDLPGQAVLFICVCHVPGYMLGVLVGGQY